MRIAVVAMVGAVISFSSLRVTADTPKTKSPSQLLPDRTANYKAAGPAIGAIDDTIPQIFAGHTERTYESEAGVHYRVLLASTEIDSEAFAMLTRARGLLGQNPLQFGDIGTASFTTSNSVFFFKGTTFVEVRANGKSSLDQLKMFAQEFAHTLDPGEGEIPVLVKHLPDWQTASQRAVYCISLRCLQEAVQLPGEGAIGEDINKEVARAFTRQPQPALTALNFDGGTEAVVANYGQSQLVIIEFTTPQFSIDNDSRIWTKIAELKSSGQPMPSAYRRVGNYSVFVFNAPDERTANALIDQVKYEQVVQWLGDDPHLYERLQKYLTETSAGVLVAVLKSSGLSLILCLAVGGLIGTMLFRHRRAQRAAAYSDAGGSIRLNLDDLTKPANAGRLLKSAEPPEHPSANS